VTLSALQNGATLLNLDTKIHKGKIKVKNSGLYKKASAGFSDNLENNLSGAKQLVELTTILDNGHLNLFRMHTNQNLKGMISIMNKSSFDFQGKIKADGDLSDVNNLNYEGNFEINSLNIPELLFKISNAAIDIDKSGADINLKGIDLNSSIINSKLKIDLRSFNPVNISGIDITSNLINVDKALEILPKLEKHMPPASKTSSKTASGKSQASNNIPLSADGKFDIKKLTTGNITAESIKGNLKIKNNELIADKLSLKAFEGTITGSAKVNLLTQLITLKTQGKNLNANKTFTDAANLKDTLSGTMNFKTDISLKGATYSEQMKSLKGNVDFKLKDGQYGPFSKLENFFLAENIRENAFFKNTIGVILTPITTIDSSHFEELKGTIKFKDGIAQLSPITSRGDILCILIKGNMDLLKNTLNSNVRVRLASGVSDSLGPLALANPVNLVKNTPGLNIATAKLFTIFTQVVDESEYKAIPDFSSKHSDANATKFQIVLKGDVAKPLKLVKSFKWLAIQKDMEAAKEFSDKYVAEQTQKAKQELVNKLQSEYEKNNKLKVGVEKALQMDTTAPAVKNVLVNEILSTALKAKTTTTGTSAKTDAVTSETTSSNEIKTDTTKTEAVKSDTAQKSETSSASSAGEMESQGEVTVSDQSS